ncbi:MAG TPA: AAA family ATPase [Natronosporangium sp.]
MEVTSATVRGDELATEQEHLAASRAALRRMRERAEALFAAGEEVAGDAFGAESLGTALAHRVRSLADQPDVPLFFGKLTFTGPAGGDGEVYHIGRRHVTDDAGEPMVLDWRAPRSRAFYRASVADPQGVTVRRRFGYAGGVLTSFEDEHLDRGEELGTASRILTAEIERPRVGPMRDIVATIQPDQDELVRADLDTTVCVQGAPGTGKTAVGLHRAAFLLYAHRERLRRAGVLVVGPNRAFLRYIEAVLPALGEVDVRQATIDELLARVPVRGTDPPDVAALKHDPRLATVLQRALARLIREPTEPLVISDGSYRWRVGVPALARVVEEVRAEALPYATGRERVRARIVALLQRQAELRRGDSPGDGWLRRMGRAKPVVALMDQVWPAVTPESLVYDLLSDPGTLAEAADGVLDPAEQERLRWPKPPRSVRAARWSAADAVLIDEAAGLLERTRSYGHVVVDEAQDLSPMQIRAIARRVEHGSVTMLGDLAQGTAPWATTDWRATLAQLGKPAAAVVPLTTGFRVPAKVLALANALLPALAVDVPAAKSLRHDGSLAVHRVGDRTAATVEQVRAALAHEGSIAVIAADADAGPLRAAIEAAGIETADPEEPGAAARVTVVPATLAKGLEYDHVIVVEPAAIVAAEPRGLHRLYVVLTRAVSRLVVLHTDPLPAPLHAAVPAA